MDSRTISIVESNIKFVLRNYLKAGFSYVLLIWVSHRQEIINRILSGLEGLDYELFVFTLVCDEKALRLRFEKDPARGPMSELPLQRLRESQELNTFKIDTTKKQPEEVASEIVTVVNKNKG